MDFYRQSPPAITGLDPVSWVIHRVDEGLFLSGNGARHVDYFKPLGIQVVISIASNEWSKNAPLDPEEFGSIIIEHVHFLEDLDTLDPALVHAFLDKTTQQIREAREKDQVVLVHCAQGKSRSPAAVIDYLLSKGDPLKVTFEEVLAQVQTDRPGVHPNKLLKQVLQERHDKRRENTIV